jgi:hypothetical protein
MKKTILLILNKGDLPFYLKDLCKALSLDPTFNIARYHVNIERKAPSVVSEQLKSLLPSFTASHADQFLPEYTVKEQTLVPTLLINLTDQPYPEIPWADIPVLHPAFLTNLSGTFSTAILQAIINKENFIKCGILRSTSEESHYNLTEGTFIVLPYNYKMTLSLTIRGVLHLLLHCISQLNSSHNPSPLTDFVNYPTISTSDINKVERQIKLARRKHQLHQLLYSYKWNIGIIDSPMEEVALHPGKKWEVKWLKEATGECFNADPFGIMEDGKPVLFFEYFNGTKGEIFLQSNGNESQNLQLSNYHCSYPFIVEEKGTIYCIPEQQASGKLSLYKYSRAAKTLEFICNILEGFHAVDPSLVFHEDKWWLFCTNAADKGADIRLYIFHSIELQGPWKPHQLNPVKTDIRSARPGGHFFRKDGQLYRPSQDSSKGYGGSLVINRIDRLSPEIYIETPVNRLHPEQLSGSYSEGWHTISSCGKFTLVDGKRKKFNPRNLLKIFRKNQHALL